MFNLNKRILKQALDLSPVATVIIDTNGPVSQIAYVNQAFEAVSGFDAGELIGHPWQDFANSDTELAGGAQCEVELECHTRLGASEKLELDMLPLYDRPGAPRYWVGTEQQHFAAEMDAHDNEREALLSVLRDARMHLRRLDGRDSTTGILSRRAFDDMLQRDWVLARREQRSLGLMLFQIDGFDAYRDVYGRHAADSCLQKVAHAITGTLRRSCDLAARFADDKFVVLITRGDEQKAAEMATNIAGKVRGLSIHHPRSPVDRFVTVSFGVATAVPTSSGSVSTLVEKTEENLAKQPGIVRGLSAI